MDLFKIRFNYYFIFLFITSNSIIFSNVPKLTVVIVIDQFAEHYKKLRPNFKYGLAQLFDKGLVYENAEYPYAGPFTAVGHTTISTGALPCHHGIIGNFWYDRSGNEKIKSDEDSSPRAAVFSPHGVYNYGKSSKNLCVDGLSDQLVLDSNNRFKVFSLSLKSRAAVGMANKLGKAVWFDPVVGRFTTSKAYFDKFPDWLNKFNNNSNLKPMEQLKWPLSYDMDSKKYDFKYFLNDEHSRFRIRIVDNNLVLLPKKGIIYKHLAEGPFSLFTMSTKANQHLLNLAEECIKTQLSPNKDSHLVIWLSLSSLDKIGHEFGSQSIVATDMIYKLDKQIGEFIERISKIVDPQDTLYVLSADHGCMPVPELLARRKIDAHRLNILPYMQIINKRVEAKFGIVSYLKAFKAPQIFVDELDFKYLKPKKVNKLDLFVKSEIKRIPHIKDVWTPTDLAKGNYNNPLEYLFKNQYFQGRSGYYNILPQPYCLIDDSKFGTGHRTPYEYDRKVPLIFYRPSYLENKKVYEKVDMTQIVPSLAILLKVKKPRGSFSNPLPGIELIRY